jgi:hypothetical protein
VIRQVAE